MIQIFRLQSLLLPSIRTLVKGLETFEFIRHSLLHILPKQFVMIRYYGILSHRNRKWRAFTILETSKFSDECEAGTNFKKTWEALFNRLAGIGPRIATTVGRERN